MSARQGWAWMGMTVALGLVAQGCIAVPVRERPRYVASPRHEAYGYGGSGYAGRYAVDVNPREARSECMQAARGYRGYRSVRAGTVSQTGPDTAQVRLFMGGIRGREYSVLCQYDARTGAAYVP